MDDMEGEEEEEQEDDEEISVEECEEKCEEECEESQIPVSSHDFQGPDHPDQRETLSIETIPYPQEMMVSESPSKSFLKLWRIQEVDGQPTLVKRDMMKETQEVEKAAETPTALEETKKTEEAAKTPTALEETKKTEKASKTPPLKRSVGRQHLWCFWSRSFEVPGCWAALGSTSVKPHDLDSLDSLRKGGEMGSRLGETDVADITGAESSIRYTRLPFFQRKLDVNVSKPIIHHLPNH